MANSRTYGTAFKRQIVEEYLAGGKLFSLARRHDVSLTLIRTWVDQYLYPSQGSLRCEADACPESAGEASAVEDYEAAAVERLNGPGDSPAPEDPG